MSEQEWRDRALEAEARLAAVAGLVDQLASALFVDEQALEQVAGVIDAEGPTITAGQVWECRFGELEHVAVVLGPAEPTARPHEPGARYWRLQRLRQSTIREDVLRRRWTLIERQETTS